MIAWKIYISNLLTAVILKFEPVVEVMWPCIKMATIAAALLPDRVAHLHTFMSSYVNFNLKF